MTYNEYAELRDKFKLSDYKISQQTGIPRSTFTAWKNGKYEPKLDKIRKIRTFFNEKLMSEKPLFSPADISMIIQFNDIETILESSEFNETKIYSTLERLLIYSYSLASEADKKAVRNILHLPDDID